LIWFTLLLLIITFSAIFVPIFLENLFLNKVLELIAVVISIFLVRRFLDHQSISSLGLKFNRQGWIDILAGIGITFVMMGLIFAIELALGWLSFDGFAWQFDSPGYIITQVFFFFVLFLGVGFGEELLSRGYHLQTIASGLNLPWGIVLSSVIFAGLHIGNPNSDSILFVFTGLFLSGLFLAFGYIRTKQLWLSIGLHIGWNFFEGVLFGFPVSGLHTYRLIVTEVTGPVLWTGGPFGPEAGLILIPALLVGMLLIYAYTQGRAKS
jgi:membrane protease YdiL (CAAX protease family)